MQKRDHRQFFAAFTTAISLWIASSAHADCNQLLHFKKAAGLIERSNDVSKDKTISYAERLGEALFPKSETFRKFYFEKTGQTNLNSKEITQDFIAQYHEFFFKKISNPSQLEELQDRSLMASLQAHGAPLDPHLTGRQNLEAISRKNLERLLGDSSHEEFIDHPEIKKFVQSMQHNFERNSHTFKIEGDFLLSSQRLTDFSGRGGLNTTYSFNREILKSDDDIFFYSRWSHKNNLSQNEEASRLYGLYETKIDYHYASQTGWISYFVMWPKDLSRFAGDYLKIDRFLSEEPEYKEASLEIAHRLYELDFTVSDYETLIRTEIGRHLLRIKKEESPKDYSEFISDLLNDADAFTEFFENTFPYIQSKGMEFKIPVAIPANEISMVKRPQGKLRKAISFIKKSLPNFSKTKK